MNGYKIHGCALPDHLYAFAAHDSPPLLSGAKRRKKSAG